MKQGSAHPAAARARRGLLLLLLSAHGTASAIDLPGKTAATLAWTAASGQVTGYSVFVSRNGSEPTEPEQQVGGLTATVSASTGDALIVWVQAYDALGNEGPASPDSDTLRFTAATGTPPAISLSPTTLAVSTPQGQSPSSRTFSVRNAGAGTLSYRLSSSVSWMTPSPITGTATTETDTVTVSFATAALAIGTHTGSVVVTNTATSATSSATVTLTVTSAGPVLFLSPTSITASVLQGQTAAPSALTLRNAGSGTLSYSLMDSASWLSLSPPSGTSTGESDTVTLTFGSSGLAAGVYSATIAITAPGASGAPRTIPVTLTVTSPVVLETSISRIERSVAHGHSPLPQTFTLRHAGTGPRSYTLVSDAPWLTVTPATGSSSGESDSITTSFDTDALLPGEHVATLRITSAGIPTVGIPVTLQVRAPTGDLDGDGASETFLWSGSSGRIAAFSHVLATPTAMGTFTGPYPSSWRMLLSGDFDADGRSDILWRERSSGAALVCLMDGLVLRGCGGPLALPGSYTLLGASDFNGDGRSDVAFRNPANGDVLACFMNGLSTAFCLPIATFPVSWRVSVGGDHDRDGFGDVVAQDPAGARLQLCGVAGPALGVCSTPPALVGAAIAMAADFDGNGAADHLWRYPTGGLYLGFPDFGSGVAFRALPPVPPNTELVGSQDFDGDGKAEIALRDPVTGNVTLWVVNGTGLVQTIPFGALGLDFTLGGADPSQ